MSLRLGITVNKKKGTRHCNRFDSTLNRSVVARLKRLAHRGANGIQVHIGCTCQQRRFVDQASRSVAILKKSTAFVIFLIGSLGNALTEHQPSACNFTFIPGCHDIAPIAKDKMKVIGKNGKAKQVNAEGGGELLQIFFDPNLAMIEILA